MALTLALAGCSSGGAATPGRLSDWLHRDLRVTDGHATSADWVLTTDSRTGAIFDGPLSTGLAHIYVVDVHGRFEARASCGLGMPESACATVGSDYVVALDPNTLEVRAETIAEKPVDLTSLGDHGHADL